MVSWPAPADVRAVSGDGPRSTLGRVAAALARASRRAGRGGRAAMLSGLRLFARFILILASLASAVAGVFVLWGVGWALLTGALGCLILEWIIKDAGSNSPDRR